MTASPDPADKPVWPFFVGTFAATASLIFGIQAVESGLDAHLTRSEIHRVTVGIFLVAAWVGWIVYLACRPRPEEDP